MTNKQRTFILAGSQFIFSALCLFGCWYVDTYYHSADNLYLSVGLLVLLCLSLYFMYKILPKWLEIRVDNTYPQNGINERVVLTGKDKMWRAVGFTISAWIYAFVLVYFMNSYVIERDVKFGFTLIVLSPMVLFSIEGLFRCYKNTYTIEGNNLIIDEWAWFHKKTEHLVIPIAEIQSISINQFSNLTNAPIEIQVAGIKRVLAAGMVSEELFTILKHKMAL